MFRLPRAAPRLCRIFGALLALLVLLAVPSARASVIRTFVPIGSDYTETTLQRFALPAAGPDLPRGPGADPGARRCLPSG